jgi:hypothetical protein
VNDNHDAAKAAFNQATKDKLPILEILTTRPSDTGQDLFFAITAEANNEVNTS